jgi:hypothetical protein
MAPPGTITTNNNIYIVIVPYSEAAERCPIGDLDAKPRFAHKAKPREDPAFMRVAAKCMMLAVRQEREHEGNDFGATVEQLRFTASIDDPTTAV